MRRRGLTHAYALLLRLYPEEYRRTWGPGMQATFARRSREIGGAGWVRRSRFAFKEFCAVLSTALTERLSRWRHEPLRDPGNPRDSLDPGRPHLHSPRSPRRNIVSNPLFDLRVAARGWRREPLTTVVVTLTLALGIGATTAVFTVVDGVLLRPLPFPTADRLVEVLETLPDGDTWTLSMPDFVDVRNQATTLDAVGVYQGTSLTWGGDGNPERINGMRVTAGFFDMLGMPVPHGRPFTDADETEDAPPTVLLGHQFWLARFDGDPTVLGQSVRLDGRDHTIIGISPAGIDFGGREPWVWLPWPITESGMRNRGGHMYSVMGRLAQDVSLRTARQEIAAIAGRIAAEYPENHAGRSATLQPLREQIVGDVQRPLFVLLGAVAMLLLIACTNVASIMLAQADARGQEVALRAALGASAGQLIRQLLAESLALTFIGGATGIALAHFGVRAIVGTLAANLPRATAVQTDGRILAFVLFITCATGIGVGLFPAFRATRVDLYAPIKAGSPAHAGTRRRFGLHRALIVAEMSLALMLVLGAGLLVQSLGKLQGVNTGFDADGALTFRIGLPTSRYETTESWTDFATELRGELAQQPGVEAVGAVGLLPFFASQTTDLQIVGDPDSLLERVQFRHTTPGFLEAMGTGVVRGRSFEDGDVTGATPVIILNQTAAHRLFGDEDPIGHRVTTGWGHHPDALEVVGVVEDVRLTGRAQAPPPAMYWPYGQYDGRSTMSYVVRTAGDAANLVPMVRSVVADLDSELPIYAVELLTDRTRRSVAQERLITWLLAGFAGLALVLAAIGIFGVMAYGVVRRRREIGVRVAIGASPGKVARMILFEGAALTVAGLAIGSAGALALASTFNHLLYDTSATDPATFAGVGALLIAVALLACYLPARRAARVDPMVVLRSE